MLLGESETDDYHPVQHPVDGLEFRVAHHQGVWHLADPAATGAWWINNVFRLYCTLYLQQLSLALELFHLLISYKRHI